MVELSRYVFICNNYAVNHTVLSVLPICESSVITLLLINRLSPTNRRHDEQQLLDAAAHYAVGQQSSTIARKPSHRDVRLPPNKRIVAAAQSPLVTAANGHNLLPFQALRSYRHSIRK